MGPTRIAATALLASPDPAAGNEPFGRSSVPASSRGRISIARPLRASASCRWGQQGYGCFLISKDMISCKKTSAQIAQNSAPKFERATDRLLSIHVSPCVSNCYYHHVAAAGRREHYANSKAAQAGLARFRLPARLPAAAEQQHFRSSSRRTRCVGSRAPTGATCILTRFLSTTVGMASGAISAAPASAAAATTAAVSGRAGRGRRSDR
ncbi:hypothetical protein GGD64_007095 [Bradyrhizobium sp. CIR3A]|nr:hypothetical protein [Bradyrhizobium sp. CIR3A]